jgi:hypothetical protein
MVIFLICKVMHGSLEEAVHSVLRFSLVSRGGWLPPKSVREGLFSPRLVYPRFYFLYISKPYATERADLDFCVRSAC